MNRRNWVLFQRSFPPIPKILRRKIWCGDLSYRDRVFIASFIFINKINVDWFIQILREVNLWYSNNITLGERKLYKIAKVVSYLNENPGVRCKYFGFDAYAGFVVDCNYHLRHSEGNIPAFGNTDRPRLTVVRDTTVDSCGLFEYNRWVIADNEAEVVGELISSQR